MFLMTLVVFSFPLSGRTTVSNSELTYHHEGNHNRLALVTYVSGNVQIRHVIALVQSLRQNGGIYSQSEVYVVITDSLINSDAFSNLNGVTTVHLKLRPEITAYPYAVKAFAAARAEEIAANRADYLAWFDPETIILSQPDGLIPDNEALAVVQPVFQSNTIGINAGNKPDDFWIPIYGTQRSAHIEIPVVETLIDRKKIQAYYNCEIFSVRSDAGILQSWGETMNKLLSDSLYAYGVCNTVQRRTFLHQAALTVVIVNKTAASGPAHLPLDCGYPLHAQQRIPDDIKISRIDSVSCAILEDMWINYPSWIEMVGASDALMEKLSDLYLNFIEIAPGLYRQEGSCNSYLVLNGDSSILIDPAGASSYPFWFRKITRDHPLSLIILTHGHNDHRDNTDMWSDTGRVAVIAQREITNLISYQKMLAGFFRHRNAIWSGQNPDHNTDTIISVPKITRYYVDSLCIETNRLTIKIWHTSGETPDHSVIYIPELKAVFVGDNYYSSFPNLYTLRGTKARWALDYVRALDIALRNEPFILLPGHGSWLSGESQISFYAGGYRNAIKYVHDETVKGMNAGTDRFTLMREINLPQEYAFIDQSYGTVPWSVRGIYEGYAGWFDENPASMYSLPLSSISEDILGLTGIDSALDLVRSYIGRKDYIRGLHLTELIVTAIPDNPEAIILRRTILECLKKNCRNYIENIWLNYALTQCSGIE